MFGNERKVKKAIGITDAKIQFVSLVDKAANKKRFLITKAANGDIDSITISKDDFHTLVDEITEMVIAEVIQKSTVMQNREQIQKSNPHYLTGIL